MIISLFLYYVLRPIIRKFNNTKINKSVIIILTMLIFISILVTFIVFGGVAVILIVIIRVILFGILGAFVGIPVFVVLSIIVKKIYIYGMLSMNIFM